MHTVHTVPERLARIEQLLETVVRQNEMLVAEVEELKQWRAKFAGAWFVIAAVASVLGFVTSEFLKKMKG